MLIDFHSHILPGADHGSDSLETSLKQLELARQAGVQTIVATPHFYPRHEELSRFLQIRKETAQRLRSAMPENAPRLLVGGEIQLCRYLERMEGLERLCVEGTRVLLLELPPSFTFSHYEQTLDALLYEKKLTVVLAHIDRYSSSVIDLLLDLGFCGQLNLDAFRHRHIRRNALYWAKSGSVVALGSDIHGTQTGYQELPNAKKHLGAEFERIMTRTQALLGL